MVKMQGLDKVISYTHPAKTSLKIRPRRRRGVKELGMNGLHWTCRLICEKKRSIFKFMLLRQKVQVNMKIFHASCCIYLSNFTVADGHSFFRPLGHKIILLPGPAKMNDSNVKIVIRPHSTSYLRDVTCIFSSGLSRWITGHLIVWVYVQLSANKYAAVIISYKFTALWRPLLTPVRPLPLPHNCIL